VLTPFPKLELKNSLNLAAFQNRLTLAQVQSIWQDVERDLDALDVIHVAICKYLQAEVFCTCDKRQQALAKKVGVASALI
jgi:predicted nucleic acid-binding protein